jgi:RNA polymerase sigma-70 factor (ECF subfamily)
MESSSVEAGDLTGAFRTYVGVDLDTAVEIIYRRAVRLSEGEAQAAQDLTQDVLAKIVTDLRAGTLAPVVEPRPWLRTLVNNQFIQQYRSETRVKRGGTQRIDSLDRHRENGFEPPSSVPDPADTVADRDLRMRLRTAINDLPPDLRVVVELMLDGHTHREIAKVLGIPENTSKTRLRAAVRHLRGFSGLAAE